MGSGSVRGLNLPWVLCDHHMDTRLICMLSFVVGSSTKWSREGTSSLQLETFLVCFHSRGIRKGRGWLLFQLVGSALGWKTSIRFPASPWISHEIFWKPHNPSAAEARMTMHSYFIWIFGGLIHSHLSSCWRSLYQRGCKNGKYFCLLSCEFIYWYFRALFSRHLKACFFFLLQTVAWISFKTGKISESSLN